MLALASHKWSALGALKDFAANRTVCPGNVVWMTTINGIPMCLAACRLTGNFKNFNSQKFTRMRPFTHILDALYVLACPFVLMGAPCRCPTGPGRCALPTWTPSGQLVCSAVVTTRNWQARPLSIAALEPCQAIKFLITSIKYPLVLCNQLNCFISAAINCQTPSGGAYGVLA